MENTNVWYFFPGMVGIALVVAAVATLGLSLWLLRAYRRAVRLLMDGRAPSVVENPSAGTAEAPRARTAFIDGVTTGPALEAERRRRAWSALGIYALAGLGAACILAIGTLHDIEELSFWRVLLVVALHMGPLVLVAPLVLGLSPHRRWVPAVVYVTMMLTYFLWRGTGSPLTRLHAGATLLLATFGPACVLLAVFFNDRVRAVAPTMMVFVTIAVTGALGTVAVFNQTPTALAVTAEIGASLGLGAGTMVFALHLLGLGAFALLTWPGIRLLVRLQARGRLSDQDLQVSVLWVFCCLVAGLDVMFAAPALFWLGPLAAALFLGGSSLGFTWLARARARADAAGPRLLVLRVFAAGKAVERLFRFIDNRWRTLGEICLIGGPDLAARTVEPRHVLDFLGKNLARTFIAEPGQLVPRVNGLGGPRDATGRSRLHELYCRANMWQTAVEALVGRTDFVLMDLRQLTAARAGARWEIDLLVRRLPLSRVLFVVDASTDRQILNDCAATAWTAAHGASTPMPKLRLFELTGSRRDEEALWSMMTGQPGATVADPATGVGRYPI